MSERCRGGGHDRIGVGLQEDLGGGEDRGSLALLPSPVGMGRPQRGRGRHRAQDVGHLVDLLGVDPLHHPGHVVGPQLGRQQVGREQLLGRLVPEVGVLHAARDLGRADQPRRHPSGAGPVLDAAQRRPPRRRPPGGGGRVVEPHRAPGRPPAQGVGHQVVLDAGGQHRPLPLQDGGHGEAGGLVGLGRAQDADGVAGLGGHQVPARVAQHQPALLRLADDQSPQIPPLGPARPLPPAVAGEDPAHAQRHHGGNGEQRDEGRIEGPRPGDESLIGRRPGQRRLARVADQAGQDRSRLARPGPGPGPAPQPARPPCPRPTPACRSRTGRTAPPGWPRRWTWRGDGGGPLMPPPAACARRCR